MTAIRRKLVIVGDSGCGKTSLLFVFTTNKLPEPEFLPSLFDSYVANIEIDDCTVELELWDTAGQPDYDRLRPVSYVNTHVCLLCFCIDSRESLHIGIDKFKQEVTQHCGNIPIVLVANKIDLRDDEEAKDRLKRKGQTFVTTEEGEEMASKINAFAYLECSAKTKEGVQEVFETVTKATLQYMSVEVPIKENKGCQIL